MNTDRRKYLKLAGSLSVGAVVFSAVGASVWKMFTNPGQLFYGSKRQKGLAEEQADEHFVSPYRRTFGFVLDDEILAFDAAGGSLYLAVPNTLYIYGMSGEMQDCFPLPSGVRDIAHYDGRLYVLFANRIEAYSLQGEFLQQWEACSDDSDYCDLAVCSEGLFVTDAANKNICKYRLDGTLDRFISSPEGFIVPSYCFAIMAMDGHIFCSNPGRHKVEQYTTDGEFVASFGAPGTEPGQFSGCCNPAILTPAHNGELLTSEKGRPRISCYSQDGRFRSVLLDAKALGGGHVAYDVRVLKDKLVVACDKKVAIYQYNRQQSQETACGQCDKDCPLKLD